MKIKTDKEFRTYQAEMEAITVKGTDLGDMELLSEEEKERYIVLSQAISEWEAAYHPLPGRVSTLITDAIRKKNGDRKYKSRKRQPGVSVSLSQGLAIYSMVVVLLISIL